jgi:phospholipase D1/2
MELTTAQSPGIVPDVAASEARGAILRAGKTCWRLARAERFALIVDAADYFAHAKQAMLEARHSIVLIGWDFDLRIRLTPEAGGEDGRMRLGDFLKSIVRRRPDLRIYILKWDMAVIYAMHWQIVPMILYDIVGTRRIHLRFDSTHPATAAHHQKIVVIDDAVAFCGGIDMTDDRWDTRTHGHRDPHRVDPAGERYGPWHDTTAAVDGEAARALGEWARERWLFATGQRLPMPPAERTIWPEGLTPQLHDLDIGIARTMPAYDGRRAVHEIEALYLTAIRAARRTIYIENQFFASARIGEALKARLEEEDGPEIVVVNPRSTKSWLEEETMDAARALIVQRLRAADRHGRFRIYDPVNAAGEPIYVHSKVLIVDDRLLRVGSSNVNNRSMGFDSECDLAFEAKEDDPRIASAIVKMRNNLLAEHLDVSPATLAQAIAEHGGLIGAIESLRNNDGRSLRPLRTRQVNEAERALVESRIADPERPAEPESRIEHAIKRAVLRHPLAAAGAIAAAGVGAYAAARLLRRSHGK